MIDSPQKQCCKCKQFFPATKEFFYANNQQKDGLHPRCKACWRVDSKPRYIPPEGYKRCPKCSETKFLEEFDLDRAKHTGRASCCKACLRIIRPLAYQQAKARGPLHEVPDEIVCKKCGISKPANKENFTAQADCRYGLKETCKVCDYAINQKPWAEAHRDIINERTNSTYYPSRKSYFTSLYQTEHDRILADQRAFQEGHPETVRGWKQKYAHTDRGHEVARARENRR